MDNEYSTQFFLNAISFDENDISHYEDLLSGLDECDDYEDEMKAHQEMLNQRSEEIQKLGRVYAEYLGFDLNTPAGLSWYEKTIAFYNSNENLFNRFKDIVSGIKQAA